MLTTFYGKKEKTGNETFKPACVVDYNQNMGDADLSYSIMLHYPTFQENHQIVQETLFEFFWLCGQLLFKIMWEKKK